VPGGSRPADVSIRFGTVDRVQIGLDVWPPALKAHVWQADGEFCLSQGQAGSFLVRRGREVVVDPLPGVDERVLRLFVLGAVLGVLLQQRGFLTLHASVVALDGEAVAFCGAAGAGKSTLARALYGNAHPFLTDDIAAVRRRDGRLVVVPGFPQVKLWPDAARSVGDDPERLPRLDPDSDKRGRRVTDLFQEDAIPCAVSMSSKRDRSRGSRPCHGRTASSRSSATPSPRSSPLPTPAPPTSGSARLLPPPFPSGASFGLAISFISAASPRWSRSTPLSHDGRRRMTPAGAPCQHAGVADPVQPPEDPVLARRARISRLVDTGQRIGYSLWLVAIVVFVAGAVTRFRPIMVTIVIGGLAAGSALLAPAIVIGYGVKAADRADRGEPDGH
jgi:hypothetical protein